MSDITGTLERLRAILESLGRIPRRFSSISAPEDFVNSPQGLDRKDAIGMVLLRAGEGFKMLDRKTHGSFLSLYPGVQWQPIVEIGDALANRYFYLDPAEIYAVCSKVVPGLIEVLGRMIQDLEAGTATRSPRIAN